MMMPEYAAVNKPRAQKPQTNVMANVMANGNDKNEYDYVTKPFKLPVTETTGNKPRTRRCWHAII